MLQTEKDVKKSIDFDRMKRRGCFLLESRKAIRKRLVKQKRSLFIQKSIRLQRC